EAGAEAAARTAAGVLTPASTTTTPIITAPRHRRSVSGNRMIAPLGVGATPPRTFHGVDTVVFGDGPGIGFASALFLPSSGLARTSPPHRGGPAGPCWTSPSTARPRTSPGDAHCLGLLKHYHSLVPLGQEAATGVLPVVGRRRHRRPPAGGQRGVRALRSPGPQVARGRRTGEQRLKPAPS